MTSDWVPAYDPASVGTVELGGGMKISRLVRTLACSILLMLSLAAPSRADLREADALSKRARLLGEAGKPIEAIPFAERALAQARAEGEGTAAHAAYLNRLAMLYRAAARFEEVEPLLKQAIEIRAQVDPKRQPDSFNDLGLLYWDLGKFAEAEIALERAVELYTEQKAPENHIATAQTNLALVYRDAGRFNEAEQLMKNGLAVRESLPRDIRELEVSNSLNNLAGFYRSQGRLTEAEPIASRAVEMRKRNLTPDHPDIATSQNVRAEILRALGRFEEAEKTLNEALASRKRTYPAGHPRIAITLNSLAGVYESQGKNTQAEAAYRAALAIREQRLQAQNPHHPDIAATRANLGALLKAQRRLAEAEPFLRSALEGRERSLGPGHPDTIKSMVMLGDLLRLRGQTGDAEAIFLRSLSVRKAAIREIPVFFATDRKEADNASGVAFGSVRGKILTLGVANVLVPTEITSRFAANIPGANTVSAISRKDIEDQTTEPARLVIRNIAKLDSSAAVQSASAAAKRAQFFSGQALVFVHGFNVSFENAIKRAAQIAFDLNFDGPMFLYTWPSRGGTTFLSSITSTFDYRYDRVSAENAGTYMEKFLQDVVSSVDVSKINIIAHSMGNKVLLEALKISSLSNTASRLKLAEIILAAPDVEKDQFELLTTYIRNLPSLKTLYVSSADKALVSSQVFWQGSPAGYAPKGSGPTVVAGIETIDITAAGDSFFAMNHDIYASNPAITNDMRLLMTGSKHPPHERSKAFEPVGSGRGAYWSYRRNAPQ